MWKRLLYNKENNYKMLAVCCLLLLAVAMVPLLLIGRYAHPCADDFTYGRLPHAFWTTTYSLAETLEWAIYQMKATYDTWQGTFSSVFLMALTPAIWGEEFYVLTPIIMLSMVVLSHFYLLYVLIVKILHAPKSLWCIVSSILTFLIIETVPSPVNSFFWYNGSVHYTFMHGCMIFMIGIAVHLEICTSVWKKVLLALLASVFAVACGGSNYYTALLGLLSLAMILAVKVILKRRNWWILLPLGADALAFYKNVTAYGNVIRQENFNGSSPFEAIGQSFPTALEYMAFWTTLPVILFAILLVPVLWKMADGCKFSFSFPVVVTVLSVCLIACMFTPSIYAMSISGPDRLLNIIKMWFCLLLIVNEAYWIGWIRRKGFLSDKARSCFSKVNLLAWAAGILCLVLVHFVLAVPMRLHNYSSYAAYVSLRAGEAAQYHEEYQERLQRLASDEAQVAVKEFSVKPYLLYFDDITEDPQNWKNTAVASWYGKEAVYLETE